MEIGRITFGPNAVPYEAEAWRKHAHQNHQTRLVDLRGARACNCIGPQPGQTKCPCRLEAESEQGASMVRDGVVIDGRKYKLVPDESVA